MTDNRLLTDTPVPASPPPASLGMLARHQPDRWPGFAGIRTRADLPSAVHEIYRWYRAGFRVIAVVSALGDTTDELLRQARELTVTPEPYATAELLATGERACAALLGLALDRSGVPSRVMNPWEVGLTVAGSPLDSELVAVDAERLRSLLTECPVLVVPGFFGTDSAGRTHVLGRGGSDLSAVFLAQRLNARRCRLLKDVDGVYEQDPARAHRIPLRRFATLTFADALAVAAPLLQPKAVSFLERYASHAEVAACGSGYESVVHGSATRLTESVCFKPSKVLLLGLGTVGGGVYQRLRANPEHFEVLGALIRNRERYAALGLPGDLLHTEIDQVAALRPDMVVDALPGIEPARLLMEHFLSLGISGISAGKALIAEHGTTLFEQALRSGATLAYSAAVGGAAPMIEAVDRCAARSPIAEVAGVLNGTCNFVLDRCAQGATLPEALTEAQAAGFAEEDSSEDLSGQDTARKLRILSRRAFGVELREGRVEALGERIAALAYKVAARGMRLRQVARVTNEAGEVRASVRFEEVAPESPLGRLCREWNGLEITSAAGEKDFVTGRGAGRWPTTESVIADLYGLHRARCRLQARDSRALPRV